MKQEKNGDQWMSRNAEIEIRQWLDQREKSLSLEFCRGLLSAWDAYMDGGEKALGEARSRTAARELTAFIKRVKVHYGKRSWHEAEIRILGVLAAEVSHQATVHVRRSNQ